MFWVILYRRLPLSPFSYVRHLALSLFLGLGFCSADQAQAEVAFYPFSINEDALAGAPDFSGLNHSLTDADRIFTKGAHFYRVGADGRPNTPDDARVRFFGISLSSAANFPNETDAPRIARRLRKLGFNAVRLHHLDSILSDSEDKPRGILTSGAFPSFNATALLRLRSFIDALRAEGIYVNLNLHVGYSFRPAVDGVTPLAPDESMPYASHPYHLFEPRMIALQLEYARELLRRLGLNNDPALAMIEINNESSLLGAWQRGDIDAIKGEYERLLQLQWQHWIVKRYGSMAAACQQWGSCDLPRQGGLLVKSAESSVLEGTYDWSGKLRKLARKGIAKLGLESPEIFGHSFEPHVQGAGLRVLDFTLFLTESDRQYLENLRRTIRAEVGNLVALTGTQMYYGGVMNADAQEAMDYVDEHFYVDHYDFPHQAWDRNDWRIRDSSALKEAWPQLLQRAYFRNVNKPFVLSEFNQAYPNRQGAEIVPVMTAFASAQDWDGLFLFQYIDGDTWNSVPDSFGLSGDWAKYASTGTAAAMFRLFQVRPLTEKKTIALTADARQMIAAMRDESAYPAYLLSRYGLNPRDAFSARIGMHYLGQGRLPFKTQADKRESAQEGLAHGGTWQVPGGGLQYAPDPGQLRVITPYSLMWAGFGRADVMNPAISDSGLAIKFSRGSRGFALLTATSRDGQILAKSKRILLTVAASVMGSQPNAVPERPKQLLPYPGSSGWWTLEPDANSNKPSGPRDAQAPVWLERVAATVFFPTHLKNIKVFPLDGSGRREAALPAALVKQNKNGFEIQLDSSDTAIGVTQANRLSPWYELVGN
ncbi:capsular biosynthesis protein [Undibacterium sp. Jales W-56]|uniref:capsular biosynthesis protein n=1 Tax=Undibacterium sp. Jales W-56 TaxID=2897325 RepID=UPI0021D222CF|nr:capsular biosynthesis protein [Undibacterium sp. Jales W-56]MCU6433263.1 capsular biosynthesis protein [Undibacterium sp. Jales W-56]